MTQDDFDFLVALASCVAPALALASIVVLGLDTWWHQRRQP